MPTLMNLPTFLTIAAIILVTVEFAVFGFGTLFLLFIAIGCLLSAGLMVIGMIDQTLLSAMMSTALLSLAAGLLLWKPLRKIQGAQQNPEDQPNVFPGVSFTLTEDLARGKSVKHKYSGIEWTLVLEGPEMLLPAGTEVEICKTAVGKLHVKAVSTP